MKKISILSITIPIFLSACSPTVNLSTPDPVKIDVNMKVDVVTREDKKSESSAKGSEITPREARRKRMAEIQALKNDRIVGEKRDGTLAIVKTPVDSSYQTYVEKVVEAENSDRKSIFESEAKQSGKPIDAVAKEWAKRAISSSFPGEWVQNEKGEWEKQ